MYETVFRHMLLPAFESLIKGRSTIADLRRLERQQWLAPGQLRQIQLDRLNGLLARAWADVPFLRTYWGDHGCRPGALRDASELSDYPILTKQLIRQNFDGMTSPSERARALEKTTGGSTGEPFRLRYSVASYAARNAAMWRGYRWAGTDLGRRTLYLWGVAPNMSAKARLREWLFHTAYNRRMLNSFELTRDNGVRYAATINAYRPRTLVAYVAPAVALAQWLLDSGTPVAAPDSIITGAEALNDSQRALIEKAFGAPVFNTYGAREFGLMGAECKERAGMHVTADQIVIETVDDAGRPVRDQPGHVLVTDTTNDAMPFVRYRNGDVATCTSAVCPCGRGLPLLASIQGRTLDLIRTRDGRLLPGEFFPHVLNNCDAIDQYQVVQHDLDRIEVKMLLRPGWPSVDLAHIRQALTTALGPAIRLELNIVDSLPLTAAGKRRVTVSHVGPLDAGERHASRN